MPVQVFNMDVALYGISKPDAIKKGICIKCKLYWRTRCYTQLGEQEYKISGLCEVCFDEITNPIVSCCNKHLVDCACLPLDGENL